VYLVDVVAKGLYVGDFNATCSLKWLMQHDVTHILDMSGKPGSRHDKLGRNYPSFINLVPVSVGGDNEKVRVKGFGGGGGGGGG
jgi:hypothetical protein